MQIAFLTLGCKVNFYETEKMIKAFRDEGFTIVDFDKNAYTEKTISEEKKMIETDYKDNIQG